MATKLRKWTKYIEKQKNKNFRDRTKIAIVFKKKKRFELTGGQNKKQYKP